MKNSHSSGKKRPHFSKNNHQERPSSSNGQFLFNRTSLLSSALEKLKGKTKKGPSTQKGTEEPKPLPNQQPSKKIKTGEQKHSIPSLSYTPLQKDLYNFFTINKVSLRAFQSVPEPKLDVGALVLAAVCDRGIGGKYLVVNLYRNKKGYIDYTDIPLIRKNQQSSLEALETFDGPGDFIIGSLTKPRNPGKIQISFSEIEDLNEKILRVGQVLVAEVKSKEELGCHLRVKGVKSFKIFLPKAGLSQEAYEAITQNKQVASVIKQIDQKKKLVKVTPITEQQIAINLKGVEEEDMSKLQIEQYVTPGTLINTKVIKVLTNGIIVKFLKIFIGFIHADHLVKPLESYTNEEKLMARVIYLCNNPPMIFLSERHRVLKKYEPQRDVYESLEKPKDLRVIQHSYLSPKDEFFAHPTHLHSQIDNLSKFWVKQNNYFEGYQIMSSKKVGIKVGDVSKTVPFTNFKVYGQGQGKFRVMCLDIWSKVIKLCYDPKVVQAKNLLFDTQQIDENQKYCGFVTSVNNNGVVIQFCNNIRGIISQRELQLNNIEINEKSLGQGVEVYIANIKKNYLGLTITPPELRKNKDKKDHPEAVNDKKQSSFMGVIHSISAKSIHPIYIKLKNKLIKVNIFDGIKPPSIDDLPLITDLESHYQVGSRVQVFCRKGKFYLYPPEQLCDKDLRFCRIVAIHGNSLRVQTKENQFKNCHICNITDLVSPYPLHEYQVGGYTIGRVIAEKEITLCKSFILNGIPKNMKDVVKNYSESEKKGDFRARIEAVGPSALKLQTVVFGYIKSFGDKGCFISLTHNFNVRVERSQLSDTYLPHPEQLFTPNKLVLCRLINMKQKVGDASAVQIDASLRESVVKLGYPINDQILQTGVGLTVKGTVTGYVKGKALVKLSSSKFTGIISLKDVEGVQEDQTLQKALPIGKQLTCKITQYSRDGQKRLIRLSTLKKVFKKFQGLQTTFDLDHSIEQLWNSFQSLSAIEAPVREGALNLAEEAANEENQYERLKKLLAQNNIEAEGNEEQLVQQQNQAQEQEEPEAMEQQIQIDDQIEEQDEEQKVEKIQSLQKKAQTKKENQQYKKKVAQFQSLPQSKEFYQSLVLANPTPESYLLYISSLLPTSTPEEIRTQFTRAINSFTSIADKDNMWISWINTEQILGDFTGTVKKAVDANVGLIVYLRILEILTDQQSWPVAIEFGKKLLKKFNRQPKAYIGFLKMANQYERSGHQLQEGISVKQIMKRAKQCLKSNQVIQIQIHHAKTLFEFKEPEQGRNILEQLVTHHPKRVDLWSVYVDQEAKSGNIDKARKILERALSIGLKKKVVITLLKKYLSLQKAHGDENSVNAIIERAKGIAHNYENLGDQSEEDIEDVD